MEGAPRKKYNTLTKKATTHQPPSPTHHISSNKLPSPLPTSPPKGKTPSPLPKSPPPQKSPLQQQPINQASNTPPQQQNSPPTEPEKDHENPPLIPEPDQPATDSTVENIVIAATSKAAAYVTNVDNAGTKQKLDYIQEESEEEESEEGEEEAKGGEEEEPEKYQAQEQPKKPTGELASDAPATDAPTMMTTIIAPAIQPGSNAPATEKGPDAPAMTTAPDAGASKAATTIDPARAEAATELVRQTLDALKEKELAQRNQKQAATKAPSPPSAVVAESQEVDAPAMDEKASIPEEPTRKKQKKAKIALVRASSRMRSGTPKQ